MQTVAYGVVLDKVLEPESLLPTTDPFDEIEQAVKKHPALTARRFGKTVLAVFIASTEVNDILPYSYINFPVLDTEETLSLLSLTHECAIPDAPRWMLL